MSRPRLLLTALGTLALVAAACTASTEDATTTVATTAAPTTSSAPSPVDRLLVLDLDGNIVTMDPDGSGLAALTDDAGASVGYFQPSWSPDGRSIVTSRTEGGNFSLVNFDLESRTQSAIATIGNAFYTYWSPKSDRLGYLSTGPEGMGLSIAEFGEAPISTSFDTGQPFYFSWSPNGEQLATYIGGQRLEVRDVVRGAAPAPIESPGAFQNPAWTDAGLFYMTSVGGADQLVLGGPDVPTRVLARSNAPAVFTVPSSGAKVAVQAAGEVDGVSASFQEAPLLPLNRLVVIDVATGEQTQVTDSIALAYFWDRAGEQLLVLDSDQGARRLRWSVWADGELRELVEFLPAPQFVESYLPFFGQYALSTTMWSPDGTAFAFAGLVGGEGGIHVQQVAGGPPIKIADGFWVMWSPV